MWIGAIVEPQSESWPRVETTELLGSEVEPQRRLRGPAVRRFTSIQRLRDLACSVDAFDIAVNDYMEDGVYRTPAWHMLGTCRMGNDPETSTVDRWHQAWEVPNLYICDGSSFATGGVVNPTSTVTALALRCARHIASKTGKLLSHPD